MVTGLAAIPLTVSWMGTTPTPESLAGIWSATWRRSLPTRIAGGFVQCPLIAPIMNELVVAEKIANSQ